MLNFLLKKISFIAGTGIFSKVAVMETGNGKTYYCKDCDKTFGHKSSLSRHKTSVHVELDLKCEDCSTTFTRKDNFLRHKRKHQTSQTGAGRKEVRRNLKKTFCNLKALNSTIQTRTIEANGLINLDPLVADQTKLDPITFFESHFDKVKAIIKNAIKKGGGLKWYLVTKIKMERRRSDYLESVPSHFRGNCQTSLKSEDVDEDLRESINNMYDSFIEYQQQGSNWTVGEIVELTIHMARYRPLRGSSYVQLPIKIRSKHAVINVKNKDNKCFMWSVLAALHPVQKHSDRISKYKDYVKELKFRNITFPVKMKDILVFEKQNEISVNVFGYEKEEIFPLHITKTKYKRHVNLLMISNSKNSHYCWIKDLNRLLFDQKTCKNRHYYCPYCLHGFTKEKLLEEHYPCCRTNVPQKTKLPSESNKWLRYKDIRKQLKVPYVIYADFETLQVPVVGYQNEKEQSSTTIRTKHEPCGFAYKVVGLTTEMSKQPVVYRGLDAAEKFVEYMMKEQVDIEQKFKNKKRMIMSRSDWGKFWNSSLCHICKKALGEDKVKDHCHMTGKFRGAAHSDCNINFKLTGRIPVIFHNLMEYDSHFIMQAIGKVGKQLKCIPKNTEKYISFSSGCMDFKDSFQFMSASLETLVDNLAKDGSSKFKHMANHFGGNKVKLLLRKQVYPYEYLTSAAKFKESQLPSIDDFYSTLSGEGISTDDYEHAQRVWEEFDIKNLGEYHDLYVTTDVLALADVFEQFREMCLNYYGLDAAHFYTTPGLAWEAALKMTDVKLELLTDIDMHLFIEKGIRGGVSMITHRHAKANNPLMSDYDPNQPKNYIMYLDANNLYGWAMSQALPVDGFKWMEKDEINNFNVKNIPDDCQDGYILEVDLDYPSNLHDSHNDYPLAPEKMQITDELLSPYAKALKTKLKLKGFSTEKLIPNLRSKEKYVVHYRNLKLYLSLGLTLTKIHRIMAFKQQPWLKRYIDFNTNKRKSAKNDFEKDFFKLMNNSVFGKTMENVRKRVDVRLVNNQSQARKLVCKPTFNAFKIFNKDLVSIHMRRGTVYLDKPIYVGLAVLDLSKTLVYEFHYNYIQNKYGQHATLLFTDTDSLCYCINTDDIYKDMLHDKQRFDSSEYDQTHPLYSADNEKVLGKMKDETRGIPIREFIGLKSKMYSFIYQEEGQIKEKKTATGITKSTKKHNTRHEDYKMCLFNQEMHMSKMTQIRSFNHQLYNIELNKIGLSPFDDKRYILEDGISSLAYGHCKI